jgi:hypothetical protein
MFSSVCPSLAAAVKMSQIWIVQYKRLSVSFYRATGGVHFQGIECIFAALLSLKRVTKAFLKLVSNFKGAS